MKYPAGGLNRWVGCTEPVATLKYFFLRLSFIHRRLLCFSSFLLLFCFLQAFALSPRSTSLLPSQLQSIPRSSLRPSLSPISIFCICISLLNHTLHHSITPYLSLFRKHTYKPFLHPAVTSFTLHDPAQQYKPHKGIHTSISPFPPLRKHPRNAQSTTIQFVCFRHHQSPPSAPVSLRSLDPKVHQDNAPPPFHTFFEQPLV